MSSCQIVREIGRGGMGCVYEAYNESGKRIALKQLNAIFATNPSYRDMFVAEVKSLRTLQSPYVVRIEGDCFSDAEGNLFLQMEYIEGKTIAQTVEENGPFTENQSKVIMGQILEAFQYIHSKGCIHRDIKPANIMIRPDGRICIIDFGIAKDTKVQTGKTIGYIVGTDGYMSPEQANAITIDHRTDIYSLGCLLFYMLTGHHAIQEVNQFETVCAILDKQFPSARAIRPELSNHIEGVIMKAVDKNMTLRFQNAAEFKSALEKYEQATDITQLLKITIGRNESNNIVIPNSFVSGHHLEITYLPANGTIRRTPQLIITDSSTNGTSVDGIFVKGTTMQVPCLNDLSQMPDIYLAGLLEGKLDWELIKYNFQIRGAWTDEEATTKYSPIEGVGKTAVSTSPTHKSSSENSPTPKSNKSGCVGSVTLIIISIIILFVLI